MCAYVLVAEDHPAQAEGLRRYLVADGHHVVVAHDGRAALELVRRRPPDLVVLDLMMPGLDGLSLSRILRTESDISILMLTARSSEDEMLAGFAGGADDYLTKPYSPRELLARTRALLRRNAGRDSGDTRTLHVGWLSVDVARHQVRVDGNPVECTPGEFAILAAMAQAPDRVFTRPQLLGYTNGVERESVERSIDVHMVNLRRKIEADPRRPTMLVTVYGVGYKLTAGAT